MRIGSLRSIEALHGKVTQRLLFSLRTPGVTFARNASTVSGQCAAGSLSRLPKTTLPQISRSQRWLSSAIEEKATIYALSTAPGTAAIAIIRISGGACIDVCILLWS